MSKSEVKYAPFYSWNCLTIDVGYREINLVIRGDSNLQKILKFLIYNLRTLDGKKGTADKILNKLNKQSFDEYKRECSKTIIDEQTKLKII